METLGPFVLGAAIGWLLYYFVRQFKIFTPRVLASAVGAILAGPFLKFITGGQEGDHVLWSYFLGIGVGFFLYALWLGFLLLAVHSGWLDGKLFDMFAASVGNPADGEKVVQAARERYRRQEETRRRRRETGTKATSESTKAQRAKQGSAPQQNSQDPWA
jgi:hypothetical protein